MDSATATALAQINRSFYRRHATEFSESRERPWLGWQRILDRAKPVLVHDRAGRPPAILDLGCGNGRFARFLGENRTEPYRYTGVDSSKALLAIARDRLANSEGAVHRFQRVDLLADDLQGQLSGGAFQLVVLFGLLHEIPDHRRRAKLLRQAARWLAPGGVLATSFWQFGDRPRFRDRRLPWEKLGQEASEPIDLRELEPGDTLLAWGGLSAATEASRLAQGFFRYCHFADSEEAERLARATGLPVLDRFRADGRSGDLNLYYLLGELVPGGS